MKICLLHSFELCGQIGPKKIIQSNKSFEETTYFLKCKKCGKERKRIVKREIRDWNNFNLLFPFYLLFLLIYNIV